MEALSLYLALAVLLALYLARKLSQRSQLPLPPGPKPWPLVGNIADFPPAGEPEWKHWLKFKEQYGPVCSLTALGQTIIIIHDREVIYELFEKKALSYSARPFATFASDMCGFEQYLVSQSPGPTFHSYRKLAHSQLGTQNALARFTEVMDLRARRFLLRLLQNPTHLDEALHSMTSAVLLKVLYGYDTPQDGKLDLLEEINERVPANLTAAIAPGAWLVDFFPALRHLPDWAPGTGFKAFARRANRINQAVTEAPFRFVKRTRAQRPGPSMVGDLLRLREEGGGSSSSGGGGGDDSKGGGGSPISEHDIKWVASSLHGAGIETTTGTHRAFFLAMALHPDVQRRAQREVDDLGLFSEGRLPGLEHRERLPYVGAVIKEVLRWLPAAPMGVPHEARHDDVLGGRWRVPRGAILLPAAMWFARDPASYRDPEAFAPERHLPTGAGGRGEPDPAGYVFGFGRRVCPGRKLVEDALFLTVAKTLAVFDVSRARDSQGREVEYRVGVTPGTIASPLPFRVAIAPRSEAHAELIRGVEREHPWDEGDSRLVEEDLHELLKDV